MSIDSTGSPATSPDSGDWAALERDVLACRRCPRLRSWCLQVAQEKRRAYATETYWGLPVPNFGDPLANRLIVGLAPAAHGANRTGRMFTGDRSGDWLYRALHRADLANRPTSVSRDDGLELSRTMIAAVCRCAPPGNKPNSDEIAACRPFLERTIRARNWRAILCLGSLAWDQTFRLLGHRPPKFGHGAETAVGEALVLASYHPSQQNTFTGRLTEAMLDEVVARFAEA
ncbi:MAG: uracil-DNA glycosylase [Fimbriimonadaceae bacterium]|nr:uracil-DNA glycosylase [Fimbriimonadaceae bacterium]